jgi:hypothetical protein
MKRGNRHGVLLTVALALACSGARRFYSHAELPKLEGDPALAVVPGPWPQVPTVVADTAEVPDDLVLPTLMALMDLPGAADACDPNTGRHRPEAAEYCVALYRTPEDWRVSWPIRNVAEASAACLPPWGGVEDADFGRDLPVFGYAHNHPCASGISSQDLTVWPLVKSDEATWVMVAYGTTPGGKLARDSRGQLIPAWGWLATGPRSAPRFYKWNQAGTVFLWDGESQRWQFHANCRPRPTSTFRPQGAPPDCSPAEPR